MRVNPKQVVPKPPEKPSLLMDTFYEYTKNSSMHGLKYIGDVQLLQPERFFWLLAFTFAMIAAAYFISNLFTRFRESPVIMSLTPTTTKLGDIPFPAIAICNMNNVRRSEAEKILAKGTQIEKSILSGFCENGTSTSQNNVTSNWDETKKLMIQLTQPCHEMIVKCYWQGEPYNCDDVFNPALTDEGMCCAFNRVKMELIYLSPKLNLNLTTSYISESIDWTPEKGYPINAPIHYLPWRPEGAGKHMGFTVVLDLEINEYYCSSEHSVGFKMLLHNPIETPKISSFGEALDAGKESRIIINPKITLSEDNIRDINVEKRECNFISERKLKYYKTYTQRNCLRECETNFTEAYCGCVLFYMPNLGARVCGLQDAQCATRAKKVMELSPSHPNYKEKNFKNLEPCNCYPGCHSIDYVMSVSSSPFSNVLEINKDYLKSHNKSYFIQSMAIVHVFFTETQFSGTLRTRLFGFTEFLSNTGGLLGLFLGFSFLSAVELAYFLTIRIWCSLSQKVPQKKEMPEWQKEYNQYKFTIPYLK